MKGPKSVVVYDIDLFTSLIDGNGIKQGSATSKIEAFRKASNNFNTELNRIRSS